MPRPQVRGSPLPVRAEGRVFVVAEHAVAVGDALPGGARGVALDEVEDDARRPRRLPARRGVARGPLHEALVEVDAVARGRRRVAAVVLVASKFDCNL